MTIHNKLILENGKIGQVLSTMGDEICKIINIAKLRFSKSKENHTHCFYDCLSAVFLLYFGTFLSGTEL